MYGACSCPLSPPTRVSTHFLTRAAASLPRPSAHHKTSFRCRLQHCWCFWGWLAAWLRTTVSVLCEEVRGGGCDGGLWATSRSPMNDPTRHRSVRQFLARATKPASCIAFDLLVVNSIFLFHLLFSTRFFFLLRRPRITATIFAGKK